MPNRENANAQIATTRWSLVLRAAEGSGPESRDALAALCEMYWYPVYSFVRRRGHGAEDAQDLTQAFFTCLLERKFLETADPERGRFRAFLLTAVRHFLANEYDREHAQKRGGAYAFVPLDFNDGEHRYDAEPPAPQLTPEALYERRWALTVLRAALRDLETEADAHGWREHLESLRPLLIGDGTPQRDVAVRLGLTDGALRVALHRLRRRLATAIRRRIEDTVLSATDVDGELAYLMTTLATEPAGPTAGRAGYGSGR